VALTTVIWQGLLWGTVHRTTAQPAIRREEPVIKQRTDLRDALRIKPGRSARLGRLDPGETLGHDRASAELETQRQLVRLRDLQDRFWAQATRAVLVVLQGIDAAGKDGTIHKVMEAFNPQGCPVTSFKVPSTEELAHDYLWRVHQHAPRKGEIGIFNRSHYEDVLIVRVHRLAKKRVWSARYGQINDFERMLTENGTTIVKFFLQIDRDEQRQRFQARYDDATRRWKFSMGDLDERKLWDDYQQAFEDALTKTSTDWAPWYVVPANNKWFRDLAVSSILADTLTDLKPAYPPEPELPKDLVIE
jgi:PPK2 family polyphosphate:nucleotide phosphotransferase